MRDELVALSLVGAGKNNQLRLRGVRRECDFLDEKLHARVVTGQILETTMELIRRIVADASSIERPALEYMLAEEQSGLRHGLITSEDMPADA